MRGFRLVSAIAVALVVFAAGAAATGAEPVPLSASGAGMVTGGAGGPGYVSFAVVGAGPVSAGDWQGVPASGYFAFVGKTSFAGAQANVLVAMQPTGVSQLCSLVWPKTVPAVVFTSANPDGGRLLITDRDQHVLVDEAVYVKAYVSFLENGRVRVELSTDDGSLGFRLWLDGWVNGDLAVRGTNGLSCA